jgi:diguanylate cyclase (GGDEF)-like protein
MDLDVVLSKLTDEEKRFVSMLIDKDPLTGAYNRRKFDQDIALLEAISKRTEKWSSLLIIDIDHFKDYNDKHGHQEGDRVLREVTSIIERSLRDYDKIHIYRYGGEEFVVIIPGVSAEDAISIGERVRANVETGSPVTISIGISQYKTISESLERLIQDADTALYEAKRTGRNKIVAYGSQRSEVRGQRSEGARDQKSEGRGQRKARDQKSETKG